LRRLDLRAKKGLGQHFLVDHRALNKLIAAAGLTPNDTVIEVGAGLGTLTRELAKKAGRVIAVEIDARMAEALSASLADVSNVEIVNADILTFSPQSLVSITSPYKVVGALPYNIGTAVLRHFLEARPQPLLMVVVLQKEVAQAIAAEPGDMGILSVSVQFYGRPTIAGYIPSRGFYPLPKVESAILRIEVYDQPCVEVADEAAFFRVVRGGFAAPRKQLRNSLAQGLGVAPSDVNALLLEVGIDPQRRAQTLSLDEWGKVYRAFADKL